jgi:hypothetical protein
MQRRTSAFCAVFGLAFVLMGLCRGVEAFRSNMPAGPITFTTLASTDVSGAAENTFVTASLNPALLVNGTNVLAVEVHQSSPTSDDLSFDLELIGIRTP